jgi:dethiobiotin synthetase
MTESNPPSGGRLFITGTDTGVGKTHVTCLIARQMISKGQRVAAYKPVCSGALESASSSAADTMTARWDDIERLKSAIEGSWSDDVICPQRFLAPLAPPIAARLEGKSVDYQKMVDGVRRFQTIDLLLIEGAGGWLSPMTETKSVADLAQSIGAPVLIVARTGLGTINHTLMTIESVRKRGLKVAGIVLNQALESDDDLSSRTNGEEIEALSGAPVLGTVSHGNDLELCQSGKVIVINWQLLAQND